MKELKVRDILQICKGKLICGNEDEVCSNFSKDTRQIKQGDVYVGIKGDNFNGSLFYEEALKKGAKVCILEEIDISKEVYKKYKDVTIVIVKDSIESLQKLANYKRSMYDIPVVAVTGSVGKTSTKDMLSSIIATHYKVLKTEGNLNNHIGLPLTILKLKDHTALVVEMGMNALGEISKLTNIAKPTICVITNIGTAHIGNLGSRQNILKAKLEILEGMKENGTLVINNDNDLLNEWHKHNNTYKVATFGIENNSNVTANKIELKEDCSEFIANVNNTELHVKVPVGGKHFVYNALCAITVGQLLDIPYENILKGIEKFELTKNRMDVRKNKENITIINDCYNANYDSTKAAIEYISKINAKRKIAVLGDMLELGEYSKNLHEKVGKEVATNQLDLLVTVGKESEYIVTSAIEHGMKKENIFQYKTNEEAIKKLKEILKSEDAVLIKASNGMHFKEIVEQIS